MSSNRNGGPSEAALCVYGWSVWIALTIGLFPWVGLWAVPLGFVLMFPAAFLLLPILIVVAALLGLVDR